MQKTPLFTTASLVLAFSSHAVAGVKGTATFKGTPPAETAIDMASDPKCKSLNAKAMTDDNAIKDGKVRDVFVYVKNAPAGTYAPVGKVTMNQKGCMYAPKVYGIMVGQELEIVNDDPTLHNVHAFAKPGEFNQAMPKQGQKIAKKFKKKQVMVDIKCDVHKWMGAHVGVLDHPFFATTNDKGEYTIENLPDGEYEVEAWHAKLGSKTQKVKVAGGAATADFAFGK